MKKQKKWSKHDEDKVLLFSSGMIFAVGMSTSLMGFIVPAIFMGIAVLVCLSLVNSDRK